MSFDAYLKIEGIPGEALDANHKDWIELTDFHYGVMQAVSGTASSSGGATVGGTSCPDMFIAKHLDRASPKLFEACASGQHFKSMVIHINRAGGDQQKYMEIKLEEVIISGLNANRGGEFPTESVTLNYGRIAIKYIQQDRATGKGAGAIAGGWDRIANKKFA